MTDCPDVREILEIATVEPGGLDRLIAGDTSEAVLTARHLAACPPCSDELVRLQRADAILRPILSSMPAPELRDRVLARVAAVGVERGGVLPAVAPAAKASPTPKPAPVSTAPATASASIAPDSTVPVSTAQAPVVGRGRRAWWPAAVAAALVVGLFGGLGIGQLILARPNGTGPSAVDESAAALSAVSRDTASLIAAPDARTVALHDMSGKPAGSLVVAGSVGRIVVTAMDLPAPAAGTEYRCWVEVNGSRSTLGEMWLTHDVAWWSGPA